MPTIVAGISGFILMGVEIMASRSLAPFLGVSVYTWTGIISLILMAIAVGNVAGGRLADRDATPNMVGKLLYICAIALALSQWIVAFGGPVVDGMNLPIILKILFFTATVFFAPAASLAMIFPMVTRMSMIVGVAPATVAGTTSAWATFGALLGTFTTGYWLVPWLGTRWLSIVFVSILLITGWYLRRDRLPWRDHFLWLIVGLLVGLPWLPRFCTRETAYYCLRLDRHTSTVSAHAQEVLRLDRLVHSYVTLEHPEELGYGYEQIYARLLAYWFDKRPFTALYIGGGGYTMPRYVAHQYPGTAQTVIEIDPGVTMLNRERWGISPSITTIHEDGRVYLERATSTYDIIFGDAFNDFTVPSHLTTVEFHQLLKQRLTPGGVYALNMIDDARYGQFLAAMIRTLRQQWRHVYVSTGSSEIRAGRNTFVLLASDQAIDRNAWSSVDAAPLNWQLTLLTDEQVDAFLRGHDASVLTDQFAPTDRYLAPVFADAH